MSLPIQEDPGSDLVPVKDRLPLAGLEPCMQLEINGGEVDLAEHHCRRPECLGSLEPEGRR